jgi:glycosyltransferase involved in cell wall biosynthesis
MREPVGLLKLIEPSSGETRRHCIAMIAACPFPYPRGTPIRVFRIAEALALRGHEVHVVTYHLGEEPLTVPFRIHRIPRVYTYRKLSPGPSLQKLFVLDPLLRGTLNRVLLEHPVEVIHAHHYEGLLAALSIPRRRRPPVIYDAHTLLHSELPDYGLAFSQRIKRVVGGMLDRHLPGRAAHVIAVAKSLQDRLIAMAAVVADRVSLVENGVEPNLFDDPAIVWADGQRRVVFAGNLAAYQGIKILLDAFRSVACRRSDVRLVLVTHSSLGAYADVIRAFGIAERVEVLNASFEQLPGYLRGAAVAVNPRLQCDGVPQKLMNYMACGCPIVSFAGSAVHLRHGVTGWIVPGADPAALAEGILRLLDDRALAQRLGAAAREQVKNECSWQRVAEKVELVYARVLTDTCRQTAPVQTSPAHNQGVT